MPALNGRFGVMAAVAPQKRQCEIERLSPAGSLVEAATTPSRWDVSSNRATVQYGICELRTSNSLKCNKRIEKQIIRNIS